MYGYLRHLAHFTNIVEAGSITGAANKMECSPSSLSESVKILEAYFKQPLLERKQRGVVPTSKGLSIYEDSRAIVQSYKSAMDINASVLSGPVKVSIPSELMMNLGAQLLKQISTIAPEINLILAAEDDVLDQTKYGRDLYVRVSKQENYANLTTLYSNQERVILVGNKDFAEKTDIQDIHSIRSLPYLCGITNKKTHVLRLDNPEEEIEFSNVIQISSVEARIELAHSGLGITACLGSSITRDIYRKSLIQLLPDRFGFPLFATIASPHREPSAATKMVAEVIANIHSIKFH